MAVCAPDSSKSLEMYEACISSVEHFGKDIGEEQKNQILMWNWDDVYRQK